MNQAIKAAVAQQTAQKLVSKASKIAERKAIKQISVKAEKAVESPKEHKSFLQKIAGVAGKAWNWLQEGGWETLLTVGTILAVTDADNKNRYTKHLAGAATIPSGTVIAKIPISADMFNDVNDRLQRQLSLYTYYAFTNSSIHFKGAQGDLVNGQIGMFIVPDPDLIIASDDSAAIVRLIREYGGRIMKLNQSGVVKIPEISKLLSVQPGMTDERRTFVQCTLYIVAVTDLDYDGPLGEFAIQYNIEMAKAANSGLVSLPDVSCKVMTYVEENYPNGNAIGPTQEMYIDQYGQQYSNFIQTSYFKSASADFSSSVGEYEQYPPGIYRIKGDAIAIFSTNGPQENEGDSYFQTYEFTVTTSQTPVWNAQNDPTNTNFWVYGAEPLSMVRTSSDLSSMSISAPSILTIQTQPFYVGFACGIGENGGDVSDADTISWTVYFNIEQLQQFPIDDFSYQLETTAQDVPRVFTKRRICDKKEKKTLDKDEKSKANAAYPRRSSTQPNR